MSYNLNEDIQAASKTTNGASAGALAFLVAPASTVLFCEVVNFPGDASQVNEVVSPSGAGGGDCCDGWQRPTPGGYQYVMGPMPNSSNTGT
ncbi:MAG: hypothetical protein M3Y56_16345, partial [Armatimonadota bacterium]|nr:hypothetical protein [Armatimonadota bacterium]